GHVLPLSYVVLRCPTCPTNKGESSTSWKVTCRVHRPLTPRSLRNLAATAQDMGERPSAAVDWSVFDYWCWRRPGQARSCRQPRPTGRKSDGDQFFCE